MCLSEPAPLDLGLGEGLDLRRRAERRDQAGVGDRQHRVGGGCDIGGGEEGERGAAHHIRQPQPAQILREARREQAEIGIMAQSLADRRQDMHALRIEPGFGGVGRLVVRQELIGREFFGEIEQRIDRLAIGERADIEPFVQQEIEITAGDERGHGCYPLRLSNVAPRAARSRNSGDTSHTQPSRPFASASIRATICASPIRSA
jgi:hypothetical protein